ncbi:tetra-peptide repeat homeobox protein 1-like isoform X1 [Wyeomyia smithii]|uniref:tetra-peptide repeat homeobox protein 1-like isoform X1 n=2 Tax=Wyeomyia smithii TaxID=174621 RepID=UPI002467C7CC|nr:tetra-peptide repeat homeobox protein 1-like isoform X1 [Wyeomyia smithii]
MKMKVLIILLPLTIASTMAITTSPIRNPNGDNRLDPTATSRKEKRGIFGFGGYAPAAPIYGHAFGHAHAIPAALPAPAPLPVLPDPDGLVVPASGPLGGPFLGAHAHTHTVVTKKIGVPIPQPYAVPVDRPFPVPVKIHVPVPVDRPYPVAVPKPFAVPVDRPYPVPVDRPYPVPVAHPVPVPVVKHVGVPVPAPVPVAIPKPFPVPVHAHVVGPDPWAAAKLW